MEAIVSAPGRIRFYLPVSEWEGAYDRMEVWRSRVGEGGPYEPLTAPSWRPACFTIPEQNAYDVQGKRLDLLVDDRIDVSVTFTGTTPVSVVNDLFAALPGFLIASFGPPAIMCTSNVGLAASLKIVGGDAAPLLGLPVGETRRGLDQHRNLSRERTYYDFIDPTGAETDFYQLRLSNSRVPVGKVYPPVPGVVRGGLPPEQLIEGEIRWYDGNGRPAENVLISLFVPQFCQGGDQLAGLYPATVEAKTDRMGYARMRLVRGARMVLSVSGTNMAREIVVPTEGQRFDLLDPAISVNSDAYKVQVPNIEVGERRSL